MVAYITLLLCTLSFCLSADLHPFSATPVTLASDQFTYGEELSTFTGNVTISSDKGALSAQQLDCIPQNDTYHFTLSKEVSIALNDGTSFSCEEASLAPTTMSVRCTSPRRVVYKQTEPPLRLESKEMVLALNPDYTVKQLDALEDVNLYIDEARVTAGTGLYLPHRKIELHPASPLESCSIIHNNGDTLTTDRMVFDQVTSILTLYHPEGAISFKNPKGEVLEAHLSAQLAEWHHDNNYLELEKNISITYPSLGHITCDHTMQLFFNEDRTLWHEVKAIGKTTIEQLSPSRSIVCNGTMVINQDNGTVQLFGSEQHPIIYSDAETTISAWDGLISYYKEENIPSPNYLQLSNHVLITTYEPNTTPPIVYQQARADKAAYYPHKQTAILYSTPSTPVVFVDTKNDVRIEAEELFIQQKEGEEPHIQGKGIVQIELTPEELVELKAPIPSLPYGPLK